LTIDLLGLHCVLFLERAPIGTRGSSTEVRGPVANRVGLIAQLAERVADNDEV
jgi:hypothetical protein